MSEDPKRIAADIVIAAITKGSFFNADGVGNAYSFQQVVQAYQQIAAVVGKPGTVRVGGSSRKA